MANLHDKLIPNFQSAAFRAAREAIIAANTITEDVAVTHMLDEWTAEHNHITAEWDRQQEVTCRDAEAEEHRLAEVEAEKERQDAKKKPKMPDFNSSRAPSSVLVKRPSQYALSKLASFDFVELWYFSLEGSNDAAKHLKSSTDDAFGISSTNDFLTLRPAALVKASLYACADHQLTFGEFLQA